MPNSDRNYRSCCLLTTSIRDYGYVVLIMIAIVSLIIQHCNIKTIDEMKQHQLLRLFSTENEYERWPVCSFQDLNRTFSSSLSPREECQDTWSLKDTILRVPYTAIINRNNMEKLGQGYKGGVHKALLQVTNDNGNDYSSCWAAVKTDHCHYIWTLQTIFRRNSDREGTACVADYAFRRNDASYLLGEYTGTLPFYTAYLNNDKGLEELMEGLLPTWGVIVTSQHTNPLRSLLPHWMLKGSPHPDKTIIGSIMPYYENMVPLKNRVTHKANSSIVAKQMLSAGRGLQFVHSLGLVFQDIISKNIGIMTTSTTGNTRKQENEENSDSHQQKQHAVLFDNTYLSQLGECTSTKYCNFCQKDDFSHISYQNHRDVTIHSAAQSDVRNLANIISSMTHDLEFVKQLKTCLIASDLTKVLERYADIV